MPVKIFFSLLARERDGNDVGRRLENMDVILGNVLRVLVWMLITP